MNRPSASRRPAAISPAISSGTAANTIVATVATATLVVMMTRRGTGVASRWMTLPSSTSAPSTLVPMISAVSGSTTENPKSPRISAGQDGSAGLVSRRTADTPIRMSGGIANSSARRGPARPAP